MTTLQTFDLVADDDHTINVLDWRPGEASPAGVIHVLHGLGEHAGRYARFANACNAHNLAVVAHNHRGHGQTDSHGHFGDNAGWDRVIADVLAVRQRIAENYPQVPVVLFGHSMGSYIAQCFVMRHGGNNVGLILSGSTLASRFELRAGNIVARLLALTTGKRTVNKTLNWAGLGKFNRPFEPTRTDSDWLSRDEREVDAYIADPLCGGAYSNQLWVDLTSGLLEIMTEKSIVSIRQNLPIMIVGGSEDPVGGQNGMTNLANAYRRTGHETVSLRIFAGGRHEMLNETNRNEVTAELVDTIKGWVGTSNRL